MTTPRVAIVLLNCNRTEDTLDCIRSLKDTGDPVDIILVDNGSMPDPGPLFLERHPDLVYLRNAENLGTPIGNNVGIQYALDHGAEYVMMLNNDTTVSASYLRPLLAAMEADPHVGVAGGKIYYASEPTRVWFAGGRYNRLTGKVEHLGLRKFDHELGSVHTGNDFISGCFALFRGSVLREVGLLDERFFAYMEDVDLNVRIVNAGYRLAYVPEATIYHRISSTIKVDSQFFLYFNMRNRLIMLKKHNRPASLLLAAPSLAYAYGRQLIRLGIKWRNWAGVRAVLRGLGDGLRGYTGTLGKGSFDRL